MMHFINQKLSMGDVIFSMGIYRHLEQTGRVVWGVADCYYEDLVRAYPSVTFMKESESPKGIFEIKVKQEYAGYLVAPLRWSDTYMKVPYSQVMAAKFSMYSLDWMDWSKDAMWVRDLNREEDLKNLLGAHGEYKLVNPHFMSIGRERRAQIPPMEGKVIEMRPIKGFSVFDWAGVMLGASEIHSVSTSTLYMFELLPITCPIHLYVRKPMEKDFSFVDYIFSKPYITHE